MEKVNDPISGSECSLVLKCSSKTFPPRDASRGSIAGGLKTHLKYAH